MSPPSSLSHLLSSDHALGSPQGKVQNKGGGEAGTQTKVPEEGAEQLFPDQGSGTADHVTPGATEVSVRTSTCDRAGVTDRQRLRVLLQAHNKCQCPQSESQAADTLISNTSGGENEGAKNCAEVAVLK